MADECFLYVSSSKNVISTLRTTYWRLTQKRRKYPKEVSRVHSWLKKKTTHILLSRMNVWTEPTKTNTLNHTYKNIVMLEQRRTCRIDRRAHIQTPFAHSNSAIQIHEYIHSHIQLALTHFETLCVRVSVCVCVDECFEVTQLNRYKRNTNTPATFYAR